MAKKMYEESNIQAIADAIRRKCGTSYGYKTCDMAAAIDTIEGLTTGALVMQGDCSYMFQNANWHWYLNEYLDRFSTLDLTDCSYMFDSTDRHDKSAGLPTTYPFAFNFVADSSIDVSNMFGGNIYLTSIGEFVNFNKVYYMNRMFHQCYRLRALPIGFNNFTFDSRSYDFNHQEIFRYCYSLRSIPEIVLASIGSLSNVSYYNSAPQYMMFENCLTLDEVRGFRPVRVISNPSQNSFVDTFKYCGRVKDIIFYMENGSPMSFADYTWYNQSINLTQYVGYVPSVYASVVTGYNSGITADKEVTDDATYQALKNDPDWWTSNVSYSRYNHDSAVNTINSLPAMNTGYANTIRFKGQSGELTDGGAINTLTAEEIAVASAKGWTVAFS